MTVLNKDIHEFDHIEKHGLLEKIKDFFKRETKEQKIERLEKEVALWSVRYKKLNTRYKNLLKQELKNAKNNK
jgi:hypothetical protein